MSGKHQGLRYFQKFLNSKASERNALAKKVLRCVLAVGFALSPWLGGEAYAGTAEAPGIVRVDGTGLTDTKFLDGTSNVAHIYAEQASGDVGLNRFKTFEVGAGQIANLYFKTSATDTNHLNTLVNTVQNQISISGTVNAIRNGQVGGNLYFISPSGMVVGSSGVINAGSLTVMGVTDTFATASDAAAAINSNAKMWDYSSNAPITIQGRINTATGIDLRTGNTVAIEKAAGNNIPNPYLRTGVVFYDIVNNDFTNVGAYDISTSRLTLTKGEDGKIAIIDPGTSKEVTSAGDGMINIRAKTFEGGTDYSGAVKLTDGSIDAIGELQMDVGKDITINSSSSIKANKITMSNNNDNIENDGTIEGISDVTIHVLGADNNFFVTGQGDQKYGTNCLVNRGTIKSTGGGISLLGRNGISNYGIIEANGQIDMTALNGVVNQGKIKSNYSNVSFVVGREFFNVAKDDTYINTHNATYVPHNLTYLNNDIEVLIEAGGNVRISYTNPSTGTIGKNPNDTATVTYAPIGIYNSSTMRSGTNISVTGGEGNVSDSGNIWLISSYNIENTATGQMIAGRQITLNARDFLHNYGLIQGVTYLDIKSIMGYVYNHASGVIRATGGNIDLSTGQANLQIDGDTNGQKKEEYRKFTPIIIEGSVEATSALNNTTSETNQGNINIRAYLGDIYVVEGTIRANAKQVTSGEKESAAGDVTLDAAQNITIGFNINSDKADDPTTDGENANKKDEKDYFFPNLQEPSGKDITISGTNITLKSGSKENNYIRMSNTATGSNTLTASNAININTNSMNIIGGTFNAGTLNATGALKLTGGTVTSTGNLTISGDKGLTIGNGAGISTGGNLTFASSEGAVINNHTWDNQNGSVTLSGKTGVTNNATITSSNGIGMTSAEGTIVNNAALTAKGGAVSFDGKGDITNNALIEANGSVYIISTGGKVTNRAGIIAGKNFATASAASLFNLRARARAVDNGSVVISGSSGVINDTKDSIQANDSVLLESSAGDISNSSSITASNGSVEINGNGDVNNTGANISAGNNVSITAATGTLSNSSAITAANNVSITSTAGAVENSSAVTASGSVEISGSNVSNSGTVTTTGGSVTISGNGSVNNSANITATGGSVEISGNGGIENTANIEASKDVSMTASAGSINNSSGSTVAASGGSVSMSGGGNITGGTVTAGDGSVSMSGGGNVTGGNVTGNDVILAGGSGSNVTAASITVDNSLQLQGDNITATIVKRGNDASGALNVGVSGAGGSNSTAQGDVNIKITSDVVFSNVNVSNANVETSGTIEVEKLHVEGKAGFVSSDTTVNIYGQGVTPDPNDTTAIQDKGDGNSSWLTLKIDDTGVQSIFVGEEAKAPNNIQDSAVQLSGKLVDYNPYDTYLEQYGDVADLFGRSDLIQASERPTGETATREEDNKVVLKQDADGLRLEEQKQE